MMLNTALGMEASGAKTVVPVMVGKPDLSKLPLIRGKRWIEWTGDGMAVAKALKDLVKPTVAEPMPPVPVAAEEMATEEPAAKPSLLSRIFGS